ncbi:MAG: fibronectin type III domain-containing protein [Marinifilaceae bacterium]|jgi:uncharacterized protein (TIGR02145 family)|nr:fibronectin type III domain-containing protein [Marinifilaceae bacterium]
MKTNQFKIFLLSMVSIFSIYSCSDDEKTTKNQSPAVPIMTLPTDKAADVEASNVSFEWQASKDPESDEVTYKLLLAKSEDMSSPEVLAKDIKETKYTANNLDAKTTYYWQVEANDKLNSIKSKVFSFTTSEVFTPKFGSVIPEDKKVDVDIKTKLAWNISGAIEGSVYDIYLGKAESLGEDDKIADGITEKEKQVDLDLNTKYYWQVVVRNTSGKSLKSSVFSFTTINPAAPKKPTLMLPADEYVGVNYKVLPTNGLYWNFEQDDQSGELSSTYDDDASFTVYISEDKNFEDSEIVLSDATKEIFKFEYTKALKASTKYYWKVVAKNTYGITTDSDIFSFTTTNFAPKMPVLTTPFEMVIKADKASAKIVWTASVDEEGDDVTYDIYLSSKWSIKETDKQASDITATEYTFDNLTPDKQYTIIVRAKDSHGNTTEFSECVKNYKKQFTTPNIPIVITEGTVTIKGKEYKTVTINGKTWLAENYAYIPFLTKEDSSAEAYVAEYEGSDLAEAKNHANYLKYGALYNQAMLDVADFIPSDWEIATDDDWIELEKLAGFKDAVKGGYGPIGGFMPRGRGTGVGDKLKATDFGGQNDFKMNITAGGIKETDGFESVSTKSFYWMKKEAKIPFGSLYKYREFTKYGDAIGYNANKPATKGMYIRLVKKK